MTLHYYYHSYIQKDIRCEYHLRNIGAIMVVIVW